MTGTFGIDYLSRRIIRNNLNLPLSAPFAHIRGVAA
jgi:hypothetical protein